LSGIISPEAKMAGPAILFWKYVENIVVR